MSRYIDADALEQHKFISWTVPEFFNEMALEQQAYQVGWNNAIEAIMENEPTADVVEVVRCKDCIHQRYCQQYIVHKGFTVERRDLKYCSFGERREDAEAANTKN